MQEPLSRTIRASRITPTPRAEQVVASAAECAALAAAYGLAGIARCQGDFVLRREPAGVIAAELKLQARVTQQCVVTLEPFEAEVTETAALRFVPAASIAEAAELAELDEAALQGPDELPYGGDSIDLGAALAEQLALALDPYPRKPGAELPAAAVDESEHPFAGLAGRGFSSDESG